MDRASLYPVFAAAVADRSPERATLSTLRAISQ
jgi:hypothetical protein